MVVPKQAHIDVDSLQNRFVKEFVQQLGPRKWPISYLDPLQDIVLYCANRSVGNAGLVLSRVLHLQWKVQPRSSVESAAQLARGFHRAFMCMRIKGWRAEEAVAMYEQTNHAELWDSYVSFPKSERANAGVEYGQAKAMAEEEMAKKKDQVKEERCKQKQDKLELQRIYQRYGHIKPLSVDFRDR